MLDTKAGIFTLNHDDLDKVIDGLFPHPKSYHRAWTVEHEGKAASMWEPVPPTQNFRAVGYVLSPNLSQPGLDAVRCIPACWAQPSEIQVG